jgi:argininosuccinate lyase
MNDDRKSLIEQYIGRPDDGPSAEPEPASRSLRGAVTAHQRLCLVLAAHLRGLASIGVVDDRAVGILARSLEHVSDHEHAPARLGDGAAWIDERTDSSLPRELRGAAMLGLAFEEWTSTAMRMGVRSSLMQAANAALTMQLAMIDIAQVHAVTLMQGFRDGQPLQPVTFGHLLGGAIGPLGTTLDQLLQRFDALNRSPLGAGSMSGEVVGAERAETANWLGFGGPLSNTFDAVANVEDHIAALQGVDSIASIVLRLMDELLAFIRADPSSFVLDDDWMGEDRQRPGHRPPVRLIALGQSLRSMCADITALIARLRSLPYGPLGQSVDAIEEESLKVLNTSVSVFADVETLFRTALAVNRAWLANRAGRGFTTSSDLAAFLMAEEELGPSDARDIASLVLRRLREDNTEMSSITDEIVDTAAMLVIGRELKVEVETMGRWFAPRRFLERRLVEGSPAPSKTREWLEYERSKADRVDAELASRRKQIREAEDEMRRWLAEQAAETTD